MRNTALGRRWQQRLELWLNKRIPARRGIQLDLKSVFIFPSWFGIGFLIMCISLFLLGTNYQNNLMLMLCDFLLALFLLNLFVSYRNFARLHLKASVPTPVYASEYAILKLTQLTSTPPDERTQPRGLLHARWWRQSHTIEWDLDGERDHAELALPMAKRGLHKLPRVTLFSDYPMGLYRCWTHLDFDQQVLVYPQPKPCAINLQQRIDNEGDSQNTHSGFDEFHTLAPYQTGEPLNRVAWKNVARGGEWVTKQFTEPHQQSGFLVLNAHSGDALETALSELTYQVDWLNERNIPYGLQLGSELIAVAQGEAHRLRCLRALACYTTGDKP